MTTTITNFDTCKDHVDLSIDCYRDTHISPSLFMENINKEGDIFFFTGCEEKIEVAPATISHHNNTMINLGRALYIIDEYAYCNIIDEVKGGQWSIKELVNELECVGTFKEEYTDALDNAGVKYSKDYRILPVCGYSQGDYCEVIVPGAFDHINDAEMCKILIRLFYDAPFYLFISIGNGDDEKQWHLTDFWQDEYEWDKENVIEKFLKFAGKDIHEPEYIESFLKSNLPETPDYPG